MLKRFILAFVVLLTLPIAAYAAIDQTAVRLAWREALRVAKHGPAIVDLADQGKLDVPRDMSFIPPKEGALLLQSWGEHVNSSFKGMVVASGTYENWYVTIDFTEEGYVSDKEAQYWDTTGSLSSVTAATEAQNLERAALGIAPVKIIGWVKKPEYDISRKRYTSAKKLSGGNGSSDPEFFNFSTHLFGREGFFYIETVWTGKGETAGAEKNRSVVDALQFNPGKRHSDYAGETVFNNRLTYVTILIAVAAIFFGFFNGGSASFTTGKAALFLGGAAVATLMFNFL